ncbi:MAG: hypothetical protein K1X75_14540 [Leptospirales bacterium]|nr:hypothetical protein [Leptospirales bacterium]
MSSDTLQSNAESLRDAVTAAYWIELHDRYTVANVRRFRSVAEASDEVIDRLREFFLDRVYPPADRRMTRDQAFQNLGSVLKSPRKLVPLVGGTIFTVFKMGRMISTALKAAYHTLEAYLESEALERELARKATERGWDSGDLLDRQRVADLIRSIPEARVRRFQKETMALFEALANVQLLRSTLDIMSSSRAVMLAHPQLYSDRERAGLEYGESILRGGYDLFLSLSSGQDRLILETIRIIENDWYDRLRMAEPDSQA